MRKAYMIGEKNGKKYVAHTDSRPLDNAEEITKAEYRRHRAAGVPSWGEQQTANAKASSYDPTRARRWRMRNWQARRAQAEMERAAQATA